MGCTPAPRAALCSFEYVYFARPDSLLEDQLVHAVRQVCLREYVKALAHLLIYALAHRYTPRAALCSFEYVYFARPYSLLEDQLLHAVRQVCFHVSKKTLTSTPQKCNRAHMHTPTQAASCSFEYV